MIKRNGYTKALLILVSIVLLSGCAVETEAPPESPPEEAVAPEDGSTISEEKSLEDLVVAYSSAALIDDYQILWADTLTQTVEAAGGECIVVSSDNNIVKQISDIEDLIAQGIDILIINPSDEVGIVPAIEAANEQGIPVITLDRAAAGGDVVTHIGFDAYEFGYGCGKVIGEALGGEGKVAHISGAAGASVSRERYEGFQAAIAEYPEMEIVFEASGDWDAAKSMAITEDLLQSHPDIAAISAHNDVMMCGAIEALQAAGVNDQVFTCGGGFMGGGREAMANGTMNTTSYVDGSALGKLAGEAAISLFLGEEVAPFVTTEIFDINADNYMEFMDK